MQDTVQLLKDCELLQIDGIENPTFKYVTAKYTFEGKYVCIGCKEEFNSRTKFKNHKYSGCS